MYSEPRLTVIEPGLTSVRTGLVKSRTDTTETNSVVLEGVAKSEALKTTLVSPNGKFSGISARFPSPSSTLTVTSTTPSTRSVAVAAFKNVVIDSVEAGAPFASTAATIIS